MEGLTGRQLMDLLLYATSQGLIDKKDYVNIKVISKTYRDKLERKLINNMVRRGEELRKNK